VNIAFTPRNHVDMSVGDGLASRETVVYADIEAVRLKAGQQAFTDLSNQFPYGRLFDPA
jgi:hypothetical protein